MDKILIAQDNEINSLKELVQKIEEKQFRTDFEEKLLESAKFKLKAIEKENTIEK